MIDFETLVEAGDLARLKAIISAPTETFSALVKESGLNAKIDFRFINLSEVDFSNSDIRGFNFTGSDLSRTNWSSALYDSSTIIEGAIVEGVIGIDYSKFKDKEFRTKKRIKEQPRAHIKKRGQCTLSDFVSISGIGVHSGRSVSLTLNPADDDAGIIFQRVALDGSIERAIRADLRAVTPTEFATVLGDASGPLCSTAEHLLAALRGLNVDNVIVEIDGPEVPIMDGSAAAFVDAIDQAGLTTRAAAPRYIEVIKPVRVSATGGAFGELRPYSHGFRVEAEIEMDHPLIGKQALSLDVEPSSFRREIARARTFGFMADVSKLWSAGFALGASFDNTLVVSEDRVLNPEGLRFADEFVRHKILDAIGDLALAGLPLIAAYKTIRGGHKLNHAVLSALMADTSAWRVVEVNTESNSAHNKTKRGIVLAEGWPGQSRP